MLEMVIVLPLLLLLLFALSEFGLAFGRWLTINNAAREGAREAVVFRTSCNATQVETDVLTTIQNYGSHLGLTIPASDVNIQGTCGGAGTNSTVSLTLPFTFQLLPIVAPSMGVTLNLLGVSVMRNEGTG